MPLRRMHDAASAALCFAAISAVSVLRRHRARAALAAARLLPMPAPLMPYERCFRHYGAYFAREAAHAQLFIFICYAPAMRCAA